MDSKDKLNTREATRAAARQLLSEGIEPTTHLIRERIGFGSNTTIQDELSRIKKERLEREKNAAAAIPADWSQSRIELFEGFFQEARRLERQEFDAERQQMQQVVDQAHQEANEARLSREEAFRLASNESTLRQAATEQIASLEATLDFTRQDLASVRNERDRLQHELDEAHQRLSAELEAARQREDRLRDEMQKAIDTTKEESAKREALAYERFEGMRIQLLQETERQRSEFVAERNQLQTELAETKKQSERRDQEWRLRTLAAEKEAASAAGEARVLERELQQVRTELSKCMEIIHQQSLRSDAHPTAVDEPTLAEGIALAEQKHQEGLEEFDILALLQDEFELTLDQARYILQRVKDAQPKAE
ncbi:DNA-binding protein [Crenobacter sp. SG2305]|uniref:DNA-binding protein n=1 Tax=Crenobacter oryzisoli TaxID=3056844 RepID=UPI0025AAC0D4|nr:DNA-binding protein [Crenobacter sp. SG2305]MDN0082439.1 DNA-binding protein [Crenobacter sp. SG2305]